MNIKPPSTRRAWAELLVNLLMWIGNISVWIAGAILIYRDRFDAWLLLWLLWVTANTWLRPRPTRPQTRGKE